MARPDTCPTCGAEDPANVGPECERGLDDWHTTAAAPPAGRVWTISPIPPELGERIEGWVQRIEAAAERNLEAAQINERAADTIEGASNQRSR